MKLTLKINKPVFAVVTNFTVNNMNFLKTSFKSTHTHTLKYNVGCLYKSVRKERKKGLIIYY